MYVQPLFKLVFIATTLYQSEALLEWLFGTKGGPGTSEQNTYIQNTALKFEVPSADNKFLQLKEAFDNLSPLDECYHIVVYNLRSKCGHLSEEEFGKLSVQLLNCQSTTEERKTYPCTDSMTLAECTKEMDPTTWNAYQIVSNRAHAICHATQQQQFRRLTELTVTQLMASANGQLEYLKQIQDGQSQLHDMTTNTVRKLFESQTDLIGNQQHLKLAQEDVLQQIHTNMMDLRQEKAMIATGNKELAELTENIKTKLEETTNQLMRQETSQMESHQKVLADLTQIHLKSQDALKKLDESSTHLLINHDEMMRHYRELYTNMERINNTVTHLLETVTFMRVHLDDRINWFSHLLAAADDKLSMITCGACHISYFLFAALAVSFLQTPTFTRVVLFILVSLNATMEIQCGHSLDFLSITIFMILLCLVYWVYVCWCRRHKSGDQTKNNVAGSLVAPTSVSQQDEDSDDRNQAPDTTTSTIPGSPPVSQPGSPLVNLSQQELRHLTTIIGQLHTSLNESGASRGYHSINTPVPSGRRVTSLTDNERPSTSAFSPIGRPEPVRPDSSTSPHIAKVRHYLETLNEDNSSVGNLSDIHPRQSTPVRSSSRASGSTNRPLCHGMTKAGTPCRLPCASGIDYCYRHRSMDT